MRIAPLASLLFALTITSQAVTIYNEDMSGDFTGAFASPDLVVLGVGANSIIGDTGNNGNNGATNGNDADYFTFTLGVGFSLTSLTIDAYSSSPGNSGSSFIGYRSGSGFAGQTAGDVDGFTLFNAGSGNILDNLGVVGSLGPGTYSFWIQETSANTVDYTITLNTVPEPSAALLLSAAGLAGLVRRRR